MTTVNYTVEGRASVRVVAWKAGAGQNETKTRAPYLYSIRPGTTHTSGALRARRRQKRSAAVQCASVLPVIVKLSSNQPPRRQRLLAFTNRHGNRGAHDRRGGRTALHSPTWRRSANAIGANSGQRACKSKTRTCCAASVFHCLVLSFGCTTSGSPTLLGFHLFAFSTTQIRRCVRGKSPKIIYRACLLITSCILF
jgi:hypothetical protein